MVGTTAQSHVYVQYPPLSFEPPGAAAVMYDDGNKAIILPSQDKITTYSVGQVALGTSVVKQGPVLSVRFSLDAKILAVQRSKNEVELINRSSGKEWRQGCRRGGENSILGFFWTDCPVCDFVVVTSSGLELYALLRGRDGLRLVNFKKWVTNWSILGATSPCTSPYQRGASIFVTLAVLIVGAPTSSPLPLLSSALPRQRLATSSSLPRQLLVLVTDPEAAAQWMPKIPLMSPKPFSGDRKKEEDLDTWVRTVPTYVRHKLTRPEQEVVVATSFLEGSAARWLNGIVQQQGYGQNFDAWAQAQRLEEFVRSVYNRWHDPQGAQKAIDAINNLCARRFKDVRELADTVERLLVVPGVRFDQQVLLTDYLRCLPAEVRTKLVDEACVEQHTFASFSEKALDIEAKLGSAHKASHDGRKRLPQDLKKKGQLMFVDHDGQTTEIDDFPDLGELTEQDGASETSDGGVVAPIKEKARGTGKKKAGRSTGQGDQGTPAWVKLGLDYEVWRDRVARGTCMNCGNYGHTSGTCRSKKVTTKVASPTMVGLSSNPRRRSLHLSYGGGEVIHKISFLVSDELPFDMLLGMYYLKVSQPQFDWDRKVLIHKLPNGRTVRLQKYKASSLIENYGCMSASSFYNYYKQNQEEGMYLVFVSEKGEGVKSPPEIEKVVAQYSDLFEEPTGVVEREVVRAIEVVPGSKVPRGRIYRMSPGELDELRLELKELTEKGWIRPSTSPYGVPVLFVPKKGGPLRMCIDYRGLNAITVKNAEPLPRIDDLLDRVQGCRYFTKIDLKSEYHQIVVRHEDQHKTAFQTRYGLYEFVVMPFGLCNAPGTFQHAMNRIFHEYLDKFIVVHLDDILIFSRTVEEHAEHLKTVLGLLRQHQYEVNLDKCEFGRTKILYLGHEISADGLRPEDAKVASIRDWPRPQTVTEVRSFLGITGYYRLFVKNYSTIASPLIDLTRLDTPWEWTEECEASFKKLKYALTHYKVLKLPDPDKPFIVTTDASQYGIDAVLAQQEGPKLRPTEYMSKKMPSQKLAKSTSGKRHIFVIVDRFTKYTRLIAMPETAKTDYVIKLFMDNWVGDRVWVKSSELGQEIGISKKLMPQYFGPWEILDIVGDQPDGPSYVIRIPARLRTYPVFHASKLAPFAATDQFPSRRSMLPPTMDGEVDIDQMVEHRVMPVSRPSGRGRPPKPRMQYRVSFKYHLDPKEDRWFTREELMRTAPQVIAGYERALKGKMPAE
ncbi:hypothetical protein CBR_g44463 [Chara braunii]|uniref:Reverse transcriptase domain-containing protein n=1 Tax=Chara braunii TaxID=69332 RepID=A0A388LXR3_CHABU|nr:hypothetical protein CBR_g44463 [Chara braunii]|eukprot:GBG87009.1 hypothetical protein CBR_g44463 [Chara braunii]